MREVFLNLVPDVIPVTRRRATYLHIRSENPAISLYDPLLMIDGIPFFNVDKFLSADPSVIDKIDVIRDVYVKGGQKFGGVINLVSVNRNMAGMELPDRAMIVNYTAIHPHRSGIPDPGNTLLWEPDIRISAGTPAGFTLVSPGEPGTYMAIFRGFGTGGDYFSSSAFLVVR
jgi:hypothetical protein